jgi:hypothetical protein
MTFTAELIEELISCPKRIVEAPTRDFREENRHRRKDMRVQSTDTAGHGFSVFIRQSLEFAEDFSLGLVYLSPEGKHVTLVRFNGQHHQSNDPLDLMKPHFHYHIHRATPTNLNAGRFSNHPAAPTPLYASFEEATAAFLASIELDDQDIATHFPGFEELPLFRGLGGVA